MVYSHDSFIANSKTFSIVITIINSKTFSDSVAWFYIDCESLCMGTSLYDSTPLVMLGGMPLSMIHEE